MAVVAPAFGQVKTGGNGGQQAAPVHNALAKYANVQKPVTAASDENVKISFDGNRYLTVIIDLAGTAVKTFERKNGTVAETIVELGSRYDGGVQLCDYDRNIPQNFKLQMSASRPQAKQS